MSQAGAADLPFIEELLDMTRGKIADIQSLPDPSVKMKELTLLRQFEEELSGKWLQAFNALALGSGD